MHSITIKGIQSEKVYDNYNMLSFLYLCVNVSNQINNLFSTYGTFSILIDCRSRSWTVDTCTLLYIYLYTSILYVLFAWSLWCENSRQTIVFFIVVPIYFNLSTYVTYEYHK